ncbi:uncharacterized protein [Pyrus communis]|uniref:uncharacterized protein n=1 Tax=Pyrus communis TaxID=23211 RepID=UPI0035BF3B6E
MAANDNNDGAPRTIQDFSMPQFSSRQSCIVYSELDATSSYEIKDYVINMLPKFSGDENQDASEHVDNFLDICGTQNIKGVSDEFIRLKLFSFSFTGDARTWFKTLPARSITYWTQLSSKFIQKFYTQSRTQRLDAAADGNILGKEPEQATTIIENVVANSSQWDSRELTRNSAYEALQQGLQVNSQAIGKLEAKVGQIDAAMSEREPGRFPSQTDANPKGKEQVNAIRTLRSGKLYDRREEVVEPKDQEENANEAVPLPSSPLAAPTPAPKLKNYDPPMPFPQRFQRQRKDKHMLDILEKFKKVQINIPLLDAVAQIPSYAKFLKGLCTNKRKFTDHEKIELTNCCSEVLTTKMPPKLQDLRSFTIPCVIGDFKFNKAFLDLGSSINLMPFSIYKQLGIGELQRTSVSLQLADRSVTYPKGLVEDVLIKVDQFIFPADFLVLDMKEDQNIPILLGHPFLATVEALIDVKEGTLKLRVQGESIEFKMFEALKLPVDVEKCSNIELLLPLLMPTSWRMSLQIC